MSGDSNDRFAQRRPLPGLLPAQRRSVASGILSTKVRSRSWAEDDAGGGAVSVEFPILVHNFSFSRSSAAACVNEFRFATDQTRLRGHWPDIVDLNFQRRVARPRWKC